MPRPPPRGPLPNSVLGNQACSQAPRTCAPFSTGDRSGLGGAGRRAVSPTRLRLRRRRPARYGRNTEHCAPRSDIFAASSSSVPYSMALARQCSAHEGIPARGNAALAQVARGGGATGTYLPSEVPSVLRHGPISKSLMPHCPKGQAQLVAAGDLAGVAAGAVLVVYHQSIGGHDSIPPFQASFRSGRSCRAALRSGEPRPSLPDLLPRHERVDGRLAHAEQLGVLVFSGYHQPWSHPMTPSFTMGVMSATIWHLPPRVLDGHPVALADAVLRRWRGGSPPWLRCVSRAANRSCGARCGTTWDGGRP